MSIGRDQVLGSIALLLVAALLILPASPSNSPRETPAPEIPFSAEEPGTIAVELTGESGRNGIYFIPRGTTVAAFLDMTGIVASEGTGDPNRAGTIRSATTVTLLPLPPRISVETMAAEKRLALGIAIDLNRASLEDLVLVPGIGEKTAEKIVEERGLNGKFRTPDDLMRIKGIKEKRLEKLRKYLCIGC